MVNGSVKVKSRLAPTFAVWTLVPVEVRDPFEAVAVQEAQPDPPEIEAAPTLSGPLKFSV
jgi:hypothetical protein